MTVAQLREVAVEKGVLSDAKGVKKQELLKILEGEG